MVQNLSKCGNYNPSLVWINKIPKKCICVHMFNFVWSIDLVRNTTNMYIHIYVYCFRPPYIDKHVYNLQVKLSGVGGWEI